MKNKKYFFRQWHRRIGLTIFIIVSIISITGILLNHTTSLKLAKSSVRNTLLLNHYNIPKIKTRSYNTYQQWIITDQNNFIYINNKEIIQCTEKLVGAIEYQGNIIGACQNELIWIDQQGHIIDRIKPYSGLPTPLKNIGTHKGEVYLKTNTNTYFFDIQKIEWSTLIKQKIISWSQPQPLPYKIKNGLHRKINTGLNWQQVILDFHSGRIFGKLGIWLYDTAAIALLFLSFSGVFMIKKKKKP